MVSARPFSTTGAVGALLSLILVLGCAPAPPADDGVALARNATSADRTIRLAGSRGSADFRISGGSTVLIDGRFLGDVRSVLLLDASCREIVELPFGPPSDPFSTAHMLIIREDGLGVSTADVPGSAPPANRDSSCAQGARRLGQPTDGSA